MRKKVLGFVMAALAISTIGAFAQTQNEAANAPAVKCEKVCKDKKIKKGEKIKGDRAKRNVFNGIQLTADQQQRLDNLNAERKANRKEAKERKKEAFDQERKAYDEKLQQILTPEQFAQYKANIEAAKEKRKMKVKEKTRKMKEVRTKAHKIDEVKN